MPALFNPRESGARRREHGWRRIAVVVAMMVGLASSGGAAPVSFDREIAPVLSARCVTCHRPDKSKGGYRLHTWAALQKPGRSGEKPVVPGDPEGSPLVHLLESSNPDERMPQDGDPLSTREIQLVRRWIEEGARPGPQPAETPVTALAAAAFPQPAAPEHYARPVPILALTFRPDGELLAAGGYHEVTFWNPRTGTLLGRVGNVARQVQQLAFSPDGKIMAVAAGTAGRLGEVKLFDAASGERIRTLATAGDLMTTVAFSPDGQRVAVGGADNAIAVYEAATGAPQYRAEVNADWVMQVAFSPDGQRLALASRDKSARIISATTGELEETYANHEDPVYAVAFTADGAGVVSGGRDRTIHLWQADDAKKLSVSATLSAPIVALARSGDRLFAGLAGGEIIEHRLQPKKLTKVGPLGRQAGGLSALAVHESSHQLATAGYDGQVQIWDLASGRKTSEFRAVP